MAWFIASTVWRIYARSLPLTPLEVHPRFRDKLLAIRVKLFSKFEKVNGATAMIHTSDRSDPY